jgi:putative ABC transport system ATP-binding protein
VSTGAAVVLEDVRKVYRAGSHGTAALDGINLCVSVGEFLALVGPSGSGKTAMLDLVAGLEAPEHGRVIVGGRDLALLSDDDRNDLRLREIGFVFPAVHLLPTFSVEENVTWPMEFLGIDWRAAHERAAAALDAVGIERAVWARRPVHLTLGEQQRVVIARAIATEPQLLLADEPTAGLDATTGEEILGLLRRLHVERGLTVILATQRAADGRAGERVLEMREGRIVRVSRPARIVSSDRRGGETIRARLGSAVLRMVAGWLAAVRGGVATRGHGVSTGVQLAGRGSAWLLAALPKGHPQCVC